MTHRDEAAYREARRALLLTDGFALVPVEVRGGDVARDLARWLDANGVACTVVEPTDDAAWGHVVADLFALTLPPDGVAMVIGPRAPTRAVVDALHLLNQRRDSVARSIGKPLLWCGPPEFIRTTWERAPDFWSIRALPIRVDAAAPRASVAPLWPALCVVDSTERLRAMLATAHRQRDRANAARIALSLADSLVARWELGEALEVVDAEPPGAELTLVRGIVLAYRGATAAARDCFARVRESKEPAIAARAQLCFANTEPNARDARWAYDEAREVFIAAGDVANEAVATANLGVAALDEGDASGAVELLDAALDLARSSADDRVIARVLSTLGAACVARRDSRRACELLEEALVLLRAVGDRRGELDALERVAEAYLNVGDPEKAERDAERAIAIARELALDAGDAANAERVRREAHQAARDG